MMMRVLGLLAALMIVNPALADGPTDMSDKDRDDFQAEVRHYLMENPDILLEMMESIEARRAVAEAQDDQSLVAENSTALTDDGFSYVGGNPDGDVTVVEFLDYQCSFCKRAHPVVKALIASDPGIRLVIKEFPILGPASLEASRAAIAVLALEGPERYATFSDLLMRHNGPLNTASIRALAREAGADPDAMERRAKDDDIARRVAETRNLGITMNINGTPSFIIGDQVTRGYIPLDAMQQLVEKARNDS